MRPWLALNSAVVLVAVAACDVSGFRWTDAGFGMSQAAARGRTSATGIRALIRDRQARYQEIGNAMRGINRELRTGAPSVAAIRRHAALIARYAPHVFSWFPRGTGPETGLRTRAKAEIWTDNGTFRQRARAFAAEAARFDRTARGGGNIAALRAGMSALAVTCRNCHDRFRGPEQEDWF